MTAGAQRVSFGAVLADGDPGVWQALLAAHTADASGRCRSCHWSGVVSARWPCRLWEAAARAREIVEQRGG